MKDNVLILLLAFLTPSAAYYCAPGTSNQMYVGQSFYSNTIRSVSPVTGAVTTVAGAVPATSTTNGASGTADGDGLNARFSSISASVFSRDGTLLYICDNGVIRTMSTDATHTVKTLASVCLSFSIAMSADNMKVLVACSSTNQLKALDIATKQITVLAGSGAAAGSTCVFGVGTAANLQDPRGVYASRTGKFLLVNSSPGYINMIDMSSMQVSLFAGSCGTYGNLDGTGSVAKFTTIRSIVMTYDESTAFVSDQNDRSIRRITFPGAVVTTVLSITTNYISYLSISPDSLYLYVYYPVFGTERGGIYKITIFTGVMAVFSGGAQSGYVDGSATTAQYRVVSTVAYYTCGCFPGKYAVGDTNVVPQVCNTCAAGKYSAFYAVTTVSSCSTCGTGTYNAVEGASTCLECAAGKYSAVVGAASITTCQMCPAGTFSGSAAGSCSPCGAGSYSLSGMSVCMQCNAAGCGPGKYLLACNGGVLSCASCTNTNT
jgi:hypothetical protein